MPGVKYLYARTSALFLGTVSLRRSITLASPPFLPCFIGTFLSSGIVTVRERDCAKEAESTQVVEVVAFSLRI